MRGRLGPMSRTVPTTQRATPLGRLGVIWRTLTAAALLIVPTAFAQIGEPSGEVLAALADYAPQLADNGDFVAASDFTFRVHEVDGVTTGVSGEGDLNDANIRFLGALVGAATGYLDGISGPVADFFRSRSVDLEGSGEVAIEVIDYVMLVSVEAPEVAGGVSTVHVHTGPQLLPVERIGPPARVLGPADAPYVVREFSDLQCPFCAVFAAEGMPVVMELLERGDVRFELHHFPLKSIHPNAVAAAEALECVAAEAAEESPEAGDEAFWAYHDALFEQQARWSDRSDPVNTFIAIAHDEGLPSEGLGLCVRSGRFSAAVEAGYKNAVEDLQLTGTPAVFMGALKVGDYRNLDEYLRLMRLGDALRVN